MSIRLPFTNDHPLRTAPALRALAAQGPLHRVRTATGDEAWLVTEYTLVRRLLSDDRLGRAHPSPDTAARAGRSALFGGPLGNFATEHTDHARMRSLLQPHFAPGRLRALQHRIEAVTTELLDDLEDHGAPADLHTALAVPLPILVICDLLGVPYSDRDHFRSWTEAAGDVHDHDRSLDGLSRLFDYGKQLVAHKRRNPSEDVISALCGTDGVSDDEVAMLSMTLLFAGHETTVVQIGMGALALLANPDQWRALLDDPGLLPGAVEEILRIPGGSAGGIPRYARTDIDLEAATIRAGELVLLDIGAANRDPAAFPSPDRVDITRSAPAHLAFGHGARYCIGAPLARMELRTVFSRLVPRFPTMEPAVPVEQLTTRTDVLTGGLTRLPVTW